MNLYKTATKENWTFPSANGLLTTSQLWQLPLTGKVSLNAVAVSLYETIKASGEVSFVNTVSNENTLNNLKLDLVKDVIATKQAESAAKLEEKAAQSHNKMIDELIAAKQAADLAALSIDELQKLKK